MNQRREIALTSFAISLVATLGMFACANRTNVECETSSNCNLKLGGECRAATAGSMWCAYPDTMCPSGYRFSTVDVGDGLSGECVPVMTPTADAAIVKDAAPPHPDEVFVGAGGFSRGCNAASVDCGARSDELPFRTVIISDFYIDTTEVTQAAYKTCVDAGACTVPNGTYDPAANPGRPVRGVEWAQAAAYCMWKGRRLPTEAEWEKAARGLDSRIFPWGAEIPTCELVQVKGCVGDTAPVTVGTKMGRSPYGVLDMAGNVAEWVSDWYADYTLRTEVDPTGPASGTNHVYRGGSFLDLSSSISLQVTKRQYTLQSSEAIGFRCARSGDRL